ncbi:MAG: DUF3152 domain-containing protein [Actinomycetia bacterium]|nr:DUF3152 domain-containing protein [Actinomycetes bacterium]
MDHGIGRFPALGVGIGFALIFGAVGCASSLSTETGVTATTVAEREPSSVVVTTLTMEDGTELDGSANTTAAIPTLQPTALTQVATTQVSTTQEATPALVVTTELVVTETTSVPFDGAIDQPLTEPEQVVRLHFESWVDDVPVDQLRAEAITILSDQRGWGRAGFRFVADDNSPFRVILAEGSDVDQLCLPLVTYSSVSCQNGPVVALNADRWRAGVDHWDAEVATYRGYLVNHEVGHLLGQRHPRPRCPVPGRPAGVMEQQTAGLEGCTGNGWPRDWEISLATARPVVYAPLPDWGPDPVPTNGER